MLGSIYVGLSGMTAYTKGLQTVSNNVANLNTDGFKAKSVTFSDLFYGSGSGGLTFVDSSFHENGGSGVAVDVSQTDFGQGNLRQTGNDLDLSIQGNGFLTLLSNGRTYYTRTGSFAVDKNGFISRQGTDYHLAILDANGQLETVNVDAKRTSPPVATTKIVFAGNVSADGTTATIDNLNVFDSNGGKQVWTVTLNKSTGAGVLNQWDVKVVDANGVTKGTGTLKFVGSVPDPANSTITITDSPTAANPLSVTLDFSQGVTSFSGGTISTVRSSSVDGNGTGDLTTITIDQDGKLKLSYSNDKSDVLGPVAIADFRDPQALTEISGGVYQNDHNIQRRVLASNTEGAGTLVSKQLEASNVNLSSEFGALILIQRGFQACSQVVSVSNDMIQQLFGIRGQG